MTPAAVFRGMMSFANFAANASAISDQQITTERTRTFCSDRSLFTALLSLPPTAVAMAVAPPTVTMMAMVIVPVVMMTMVIVAVVVNRRTKIVLGSGFADWRQRR
jgi:hypothetical protein